MAMSGDPVARGYWRLAFARLRRDQLAMAIAGLLLVVFSACFLGAPLFAMLLGHGPDTVFPSAVHGFTPVGVWTRVPNENYTGGHATGTTLMVLGADGTVGRDEFMRLLYGGRATIEVAAGATLIAVVIGTTLGALAGYRGGRVDAAVVWLTDFALAFPVVLMAIALGATVSDRYSRYTLGGLVDPGVLSLAVFLGLFIWPYPARLARVQVLELRERPFVEAARMVGARPRQILIGHIAPHLIPIMIPPATIMFATTMLLEASLSMLGVGIDPNTASWGGMLASQIGWLTALASGESLSLSSRLVVVPSLAVLGTAGAAAVLGEQIRRALDPAGD
jgi:peptide/nickel transport system permease protein